MNDMQPKSVRLSLVIGICSLITLMPVDVRGQAVTEKPLDAGSAPAVDDVQPDRRVDEAEVLNAVGQRMSQVRKFLVARQTAAQTQQIQRDIIADLQRLLDQRSESASPSQSNAEQQKSEQNDPSADSELAGKTGKQDSEPSTGTDQAATAEPAVLSQEFQDKIWGHLPDRLRDQMRNSEVEKFLPKYEQLIRAYYRRLAAELPAR